MKIDIVVKSFNRPYYLDRCIKSIKKNILGEYQIIVLDDGTPSEYLKKISMDYPDLIIKSSPLASEKTMAINSYLQDGLSFIKKNIPVSFWRNEIKDLSSIFFLIEDDIWITEKIDLNIVYSDMIKNNVMMLKTSWLGNSRLHSGAKKEISKMTEEIIPNITLATQAIVLNRFYFRSIIHKTGILDKTKFDLKYQLPLYSMYTVASAFFSKDYWLFLWDTNQDNVDELLQLKKAWLWYNKQGGRFAKTKIEATKTSFISSSTNSFSNIDFDMFHFNDIINKLWLSNAFDSMENFPNDFSDKYIAMWLRKAGNCNASSEGWEKWSTRFKQQYTDFGCEI